MFMRFNLRQLFIPCILIASTVPLNAQQKGQYMPVQFGLNAGILPISGFSYISMDINYSTDRLNGPNGNAVPGNAHLNVWALDLVAATHFGLASETRGHPGR